MVKIRIGVQKSDMHVRANSPLELSYVEPATNEDFSWRWKEGGLCSNGCLWGKWKMFIFYLQLDWRIYWILPWVKT